MTDRTTRHLRLTYVVGVSAAVGVLLLTDASPSIPGAVAGFLFGVLDGKHSAGVDGSGAKQRFQALYTLVPLALGLLVIEFGPSVGVSVGVPTLATLLVGSAVGNVFGRVLGHATG